MSRWITCGTCNRIGGKLPGLDFGHLYKFIASVGLLLFAAAMIVPWVFSQALAGLDMPEEKILTLSTTAGNVIRARQEMISWGQGALPYVVIAFLLLGGVCLFIGLKGWKARQGVKDGLEDEDLSSKKAATFERLGNDAVARKYQEEASGGDEDEKVGTDTVATLARDAHSEDRSTAREQTIESNATHSAPPPRPDLAKLRKEREERIRWAENRTQSMLQTSIGSTFEVTPNVRLTAGSGAGATFDLMLDPDMESDWAQLALDIVLSTSSGVSVRLFERMCRMAISTRGLKEGLVYTGVRGRPPKAATNGVIFFIVDEAKDIHRFNWLRDKVVSLNSVFKKPVGVIIIDMDRFESLRAQDFRSALASVWSGLNENVVLLQGQSESSLIEDAQITASIAVG